MVYRSKVGKLGKRSKSLSLGYERLTALQQDSSLPIPLFPTSQLHANTAIELLFYQTRELVYVNAFFLLLWACLIRDDRTLSKDPLSLLPLRHPVLGTATITRVSVVASHYMHMTFANYYVVYLQNPSADDPDLEMILNSVSMIRVSLSAKSTGRVRHD